VTLKWLPNRTVNCVLAVVHSRSGIFQALLPVRKAGSAGCGCWHWRLLARYGGVAWLSVDGTRLLGADEEARRDVRWLVPDEHGALETYPAETFGPLPG
jgi:hypothetical protein